ncbi:hypothetical protein AVEN_87303-1 [Araneus ventricosus]|uniref:Uncharacterized protein n=1 Tax=Araneus ventricosus TaxID=182803 RepID=A0A4Y2PKP4_ARAVE|nr:hypothetical protein AVEN_87303-1 [Araneus ventricosus]
MMRTAPELAPPLQASRPRQWEDVWPLRVIQRAAGPIQGGSSLESGFKPGALRSRSRNLTTRPVQPYFSNDVKTTAVNWLNGQGRDFYQAGLNKLVLRSDKCLNRFGDDVEK